MSLSTPDQNRLNSALSKAGLRSTRQREQVYAVILEKRDHPTADELYARCREAMPGISLATVYNCLDTLVACGLVRTVNWEREPSRFCPNLHEHAHFRDKKTGEVFDIDLPDEVLGEIESILPEGFEAESVELTFRGQHRTNT